MEQDKEIVKPSKKEKIIKWSEKVEREREVFNFSKKAIYVILECSEFFFLLNKYVELNLWLVYDHKGHLTNNTVQNIHNMLSLKTK